MSIDVTGELAAMESAASALAPLSEDAQARVLTWLQSALGVEPLITPQSADHAAVPEESGQASRSPAPREFLASKGARTDVERIACLAYYLTHHRGTPYFQTKDLNDLNTEAAGPRFSNAAYSASNAVKKNGFLTTAPGGKRQITPRGEALVEALPDREAAKAALDAMPGKPRRTISRRKKSSVGTGADE